MKCRLHDCHCFKKMQEDTKYRKEYRNLDVTNSKKGTKGYSSVVKHLVSSWVHFLVLKKKSKRQY